MPEQPTFAYTKLAEATFEGALLAIAFPSPGFVSHVAARYLATSQNLPLVGAFHTKAMAPAVTLDQGIPRPTVRVHVGAKVCGLDRSCDQLAVLISDILPPEDIQAAMAHDLLEWAEGVGVSMVFILEGMSHGDPSADEPRISGASSSLPCREHLLKVGIDLLDGVVVGSMTGALLEEASRRAQGPCVVGLFVEAHNQFRDAAAAAALVESVDKFLLHIPIDAAPLRAMAEQLTTQLRQAQRTTGGALPSMYA